MENEKSMFNTAVEADTGDVDVELVTAQNEKITRINIPPFIDIQVIIWGDRIFCLTEQETDDYCSIYKEVFSYVVPSCVVPITGPA